MPAAESSQITGKDTADSVKEDFYYHALYV